MGAVNERINSHAKDHMAKEVADPSKAQKQAFSYFYR